MRGRAIDAETRAAIAADLTAGETRKTVARRYGVSESAVARYSPFNARGAVYRRKLASVNDLRALFLEHLSESFQALHNITDLTNDRGWLRDQAADELATLYGVIFDKAGKLTGAALARSDVDPAVVPRLIDAQPGTDSDDPSDAA